MIGKLATYLSQEILIFEILFRAAKLKKFSHLTYFSFDMLYCSLACIKRYKKQRHTLVQIQTPCILLKNGRKERGKKKAWHCSVSCAVSRKYMKLESRENVSLAQTARSLTALCCLWWPTPLCPLCPRWPCWPWWPWWPCWPWWPWWPASHLAYSLMAPPFISLLPLPLDSQISMLAR